MTTIATDGRTMAGDGMITSGDSVFGLNSQKIFRLSDGRLVGMAGCSYNKDGFLKWIEEGGDVPEITDTFEALVLSPDGTCVSYDEHCRCIPEELPTATGSGRMIAIGAMEAGASPEEAVRIAAKRDCQTGGTITSMSIERALKVA